MKINATLKLFITFFFVFSLMASITSFIFSDPNQELSNEEITMPASFHQEGYQIQYSMDFFNSSTTNLQVNDAITSRDGVTYIVGQAKDTDWQFGGFEGTVNQEKGFVAALTDAGTWLWVRVDSSSNGSSRLNAIDLTNNGDLIVGGVFITETNWFGPTGGEALLGQDIGSSPFAFNMNEDGDVTWLGSLRGNAYRLNNADLNDIVVNGDAAYATGTSYGIMFWQDSKQTMGDSSGDAYVVKFSIHDGQVSHAVDSCTENDDNNMDSNGYCNSDGDITPKESGHSIIVSNNGTIIVAVTYDNPTFFGRDSVTMNESPTTVVHSDVAVWNLNEDLTHISISPQRTNLTDSVVGIEQLSDGNTFLAINSGFMMGSNPLWQDQINGHLIQLDHDLSSSKIYNATSGRTVLLDMVVDSETNNLELIGFASHNPKNQSGVVFAGNSYYPSISNPLFDSSSLLVTEFSTQGFQHGQTIDLPPTHKLELQQSPSSVTSNNGSVRIISFTEVVNYLNLTYPQQVKFAGDQFQVEPYLGIVGHFEWDSDQDGIPNRIDMWDDNNDPDHDGIDNDLDNCNTIYNPTQQNSDNDSIGDACDDNDDNDALEDVDDDCPLIPGNSSSGCPFQILEGCIDRLAINYNPLANHNNTSCRYDIDGDGIEDSIDNCDTEPEDFDGWIDDDGCLDIDNDNDSFNDTDDACPNVHATANGNSDNNSDGCPDFCDLECQTCPDCDIPNSNDKLGCTYSNATNFNESANIDNGSCVFSVTSDPETVPPDDGDFDFGDVIVIGGASLLAGIGISSLLPQSGGGRLGDGKKKKPDIDIDIDDIGDVFDDLDIDLDLDPDLDLDKPEVVKKPIRKTGGSDQYFKSGVERQQAMTDSADPLLDDYVEDES